MHAKPYTIRDANEQDTLEVTRMHAQSWMDTYPNEEAGVTPEWVRARTERWFSEESLQRKRDAIAKSNIDSDSMYRVAVSPEGKIIGVAAPYRNEAVQRVGAIYVDKAYHGTGLAQALMDEIIAWSDQTRPLQLTVATYNGRARAFYRKYNFEETGDPAEIVKDVIPAITMIRKGDKQ